MKYSDQKLIKSNYNKLDKPKTINPTVKTPMNYFDLQQNVKANE